MKRRQRPNPLNDLAQVQAQLPRGEAWLDQVGDSGALPESDLWQLLCDALAQRRDLAVAEQLRGLAALLQRRRRGEALPVLDLYTDEHERAPDARLGQTWQAYKRALARADWDAVAAHLAELEAHLDGARREP